MWAAGRHVLHLEHGAQKVRVGADVVTEARAHLVGEGRWLNGRGRVLEAVVPA